MCPDGLKYHYNSVHSYNSLMMITVLKCQEFFQISVLSTTRGHQFKLMKQECRHFVVVIGDIFLLELSTFETFYARM